jgi:serine/threonine protein phosphatase 1
VSIEISSSVVPLSRDARLPQGVSVAAIGDIHGQLDLLNALMAYLDEAVWPKAFGATKAQISLGDVTDRGPRGIACYDRLRLGSSHPDVDTRVLWGNHDLMLALVLGASGTKLESLIDQWGMWGGQEVIAELTEYHGLPREYNLNHFTEDMARSLGEARLNFFRRFEDYLRCGEFLFVHAGIDPRRQWSASLADKRKRFLDDPETHWACIREPFLSGKHDFPGIVVHGHTPKLKPVINEFRIGIDTGAYLTGVLTAVFIDTDVAPGVVRLISASRAEDLARQRYRDNL